MKLVMCVVRDVRADCFGNPFFVQSLGVAERQFGDEVNRAEDTNLLYKHPEDFELYRLGAFDCATGRFQLDEAPVQLTEGRAQVRKLKSVS